MSTGRGVTVKKQLVEDSISFDIMTLLRLGVFKEPPGCPGRLLWPRAGARGRGRAGAPQPSYHRLDFVTTGGLGELIGLRLSYSFILRSGEELASDQWVGLTSTPNHFGGITRWFVCPLSVDGRACERRCRKLYLPPGAKYFGCRECYGLTYEGRQRHRDRFYDGFEKPLRQIERAKGELSQARTPQRIGRGYRHLQEAAASLMKFSIVGSRR